MEKKKEYRSDELIFEVEYLNGKRNWKEYDHSGGNLILWYVEIYKILF